MASKANQIFAAKIEKRARAEDAVLFGGLAAYLEQVAAAKQPTDLLHNLTGPLLSSWPATKASIEQRMKQKWPDDPEAAMRSAANSFRRSAGTNFQALVSYAIARFLVVSGSAWFVQHPVQREFREALAIEFTAGIETGDAQDGDAGEAPGEKEEPGEVENEGEAELSTSTVIQPDVDILLRNAGWDAGTGGPEPVVLLSVKTSLVDRAGMAARWKTYFDLATHPCPHEQEGDCAYRKLGIRMENAGRYFIVHGIVTANIYKIQFHDRRYRKGELASGQTRSNTYMFDLKLTTRDDAEAETPADWRQLEELELTLREISARFSLPA